MKMVEYLRNDQKSSNEVDVQLYNMHAFIDSSGTAHHFQLVTFEFSLNIFTEFTEFIARYTFPGPIFLKI